MDVAASWLFLLVLLVLLILIGLAAFGKVNVGLLLGWLAILLALWWLTEAGRVAYRELPAETKRIEPPAPRPPVADDPAEDSPSLPSGPPAPAQGSLGVW
jgi:hypothetical protein